MTISMPVIESIREMSLRGLTNEEIHRRTGVSVPTIRKYINIEDFSLGLPIKDCRPSKLDPFKPFIDGILEQDRHTWRKQRHSALRIYERLTQETDYDGKYGIVKNYVKRRKAEMDIADQSFLELVWFPGEAQADFGDVDALFRGQVTRMHFLVLSFPFSNMGYAQLFAGETAECVCQGLRDMFEHIGVVPKRIIFDNATGAGRRFGKLVREAELFSRMRTHYGFEATYANPDAGHEKGNVERKVSWIRSHLFTPVPHVDDISLFNSSLLSRCDDYRKTIHYERDMTWGELFERDLAASRDLPKKPFTCIRYGRAMCDKRGDAMVDGGHRYHVSDHVASRYVNVGYAAHTVSFFDDTGEMLCEHTRRFGAPANGPDAVSQLPQLMRKTGAWRNSALRCSMPIDVSMHMDELESRALSDLFGLMRRWCDSYSLDEVGSALSNVLSSTSRIRESDVDMMLARMSGFGLGSDPDIGPDLGIYDSFLGGDVA